MTTGLDEISGIIPPSEPIAPPQEGAPVPGRRRGRPPGSGKAVGTASLTAAGNKTAPEAVPMPKPGVIAASIGQMYGFAALGLRPHRPKTAMVLMASAEDCGKAWEQAAEENPAIRRMLLSLTTVSTYGILVAAHAPIVMTLVAEGREIKAARAEVESGPAMAAPTPLFAVPEPGLGNHRKDEV